VVQEAELDRLGLVELHRLEGRFATDRRGVPTAGPPRRDPRQPRHLVGMQEPASGAVGERLREQGTLTTPRPDRERHQHHEGRHHQREVGAQCARAAVEQQRGVPERVGGHRDEVPQERSTQLDDAVAARDREAEADAEERREEGVRERAEHPADHEEEDGVLDATHPAVLAEVGLAEVEDVLHEREADADHPGVHDAVEDAVELRPPVDQQQHDEQALRGLLGQRRHEDRLDLLAGAQRERVERLQEQGCARGHEGAPAETEQQQRPGLRLVAVEPQVAPDQRRHRDRREDDADHDRLGSSRRQEHQCHHTRADEHHGAHQRGEDDGVPTAHGPSLVASAPAPGSAGGDGRDLIDVRSGAGPVVQWRGERIT
jgi:hypothetical protein